MKKHFFDVKRGWWFLLEECFLLFLYIEIDADLIHSYFMRLNINIDFSDTYPIENVEGSLSRFHFTSLDTSGNPVTLHVCISDNCNPFLPDVFNLAFGPLNESGEIDDVAVIKHSQSSKVYSTILLGALTFLNANRGQYVGIDGSNLVRSCLYYKLFQLNHDYLSRYLNSFGIKYYIRLLSGKEKGDPFVLDDEDLASSPIRIPRHFSIKWNKMFNYFIFNLIPDA